MRKIQQLSASVVNKIAAGEVIERPASVVKELLENAVDAGATRIDVAMEQGGSELIRVVDNGHGIPAEELLLAVASHATSKIRTADDLFSVDTLGFRGEALASIAEVSQFRIRSRPHDCDAGSELEIHGGNIAKVVPCGCPLGTSIEVRNLFFNTPVRRKFMRTTPTEVGHASEALTRLALAHSGVHFTLKHNDRLNTELPAVDDLKQRVSSLFGPELAESLIWVESSDGEVSISGYVAHPSQSRGNNKMQYLFLNGRHIRDRSLQHALAEAYRGLLLTGRYPICFLQLEMPPDQVDVNVHPTKLEVRFENGGQLYKQLLAMLRNRFLTTDLTSKVPLKDSDAEAIVDPAQAASVRDQFRSWPKDGEKSFALQSPKSESQGRLELQYPSSDHSRQMSPASALGRVSEFRPFSPLSSSAAPTVRVDESHHTQSHHVESYRDAANLAEADGTESIQSGASNHLASEGSLPAFQAHNRYLVTESDEGIVIIDQHALHERLIYEELREKVLANSVEKQKLLVPEPVKLTPTEYAAVIDSQEMLSEMGIEVEPFGGDTVLVSSYPSMLANFDPTEMIRQLAHQMSGGTKKSPDRRDILDEMLHMISCKAAIKAGDRLSKEEVAELIERRHFVKDSHHCPHGRPTTLVFTREELDRQFQRT